MTSSAGLRVTVRIGSISALAQMDVANAFEEREGLRARPLEGIAPNDGPIAPTGMNLVHFVHQFIVAARRTA